MLWIIVVLRMLSGSLRTAKRFRNHFSLHWPEATRGPYLSAGRMATQFSLYHGEHTGDFCLSGH